MRLTKALFMSSSVSLMSEGICLSFILHATNWCKKSSFVRLHFYMAFCVRCHSKTNEPMLVMEGH